MNINLTRWQLFFSWLISILLGSLLCTIFSGAGIWMIVLFAIYSSLASLPYLVIILMTQVMCKSFMHIQWIHLTITLITWLVFVFSFDDKIWSLILIPYYIVGFTSQFLFHAKNRSDQEFIHSK